MSSNSAFFRDICDRRNRRSPQADIVRVGSKELGDKNCRKFQPECIDSKFIEMIQANAAEFAKNEQKRINANNREKKKAVKVAKDIKENNRRHEIAVARKAFADAEKTNADTAKTNADAAKTNADTAKIYAETNQMLVRAICSPERNVNNV